MRRTSTLFLQAVIALIGIVAVFIMIRFPLTEGRAVNLDLFSIYSDPFIIYGYVASIPFFVALYQAYKLLSNVGRNRIFSPSSVRMLRTIKYCAIILAILIILAGLYVRIFHAADDDPAGFLAICIVSIFISIVVVILATSFQKKLQRPDKIKKGNELSV